MCMHGAPDGERQPTMLFQHCELYCVFLKCESIWFWLCASLEAVTHSYGHSVYVSVHESVYWIESSIHIYVVYYCAYLYIYYIYSYMLHVYDTYIRLCVNAEKEKKWSGSWYFCTVSVHYAWHYGKRKKIAFHAIIANYSNRQCRYSNLDQAANLTPLHIIELQQNTFNICLKATTKIVLFSYRK